MNILQQIEMLEKLEKKATPGEWDARVNEFSNLAQARHIWTEYGFICELRSPLNSAEGGMG